jgi:hypothetical protein
MARISGIESLENKIEIAKEDVVRAKGRYDTAVKKLSDLMDKRDAIRRDQLVTAIMKSDKSHDEILKFLDRETVQDV